MHSSTSNSERLTASDRPGVAQPVPERPIPARPWGPIGAIALVLMLFLTGVWEWNARRLQLLPGDLADGTGDWVEQRRKVDAGQGEVVLIGDSRILFDTDLDHFEKLTGIRPVQLALPGTNGRPFLQDLSDDPDFKGLVVVGMAEPLYFRDNIGLMGDALDRHKFEAPSQRSSWVIQSQLERVLGFLEDNYRLSNLIKRLDTGWRTGPRGPYLDVWKVRSGGRDRQTWLWPRIETDERLRLHAIAVWNSHKGPPVPDEIIQMTQETTRVAVEKIRARGGDVILLRPPSSGALRAGERIGFARKRFWEPLLAAAKLEGIHFEDFATMQDLKVPEESHLSRACATVFTDAYVREIARRIERVKIRPEHAEPLTKEC